VSTELTDHLNVYLVGGAVRDILLGKDPKDRDYVVVDSSPEEMLSLGFYQVGADFPVFLHPKTGDEYALARTERKTGDGYGGFTVATTGVTLEQDLSRRDLTINSMAMDLKTGAVIDPFGGQADLKRKVLRHVSEAFSEDPLRVVRLARFYARLGDFTIAIDTVRLAVQLVEAGKLEHLSRERFWDEVMKVFKHAQGLQESDRPDVLARFFMMLSTLQVMDNVSHMKKMFGGYKFHGENLFKFVKVLDYFKKLYAAEDYMFFVLATIVPYTADGVDFMPSRLVEVVENKRWLRGVRDAETALKLCNKTRLYSNDRRAFHDISTVMLALEEAMDVKLDIPAMTFLKAAHKSREVVAAPYLHLKGAEISKAMNAERLKLIKEVLGE
jgi:tRNA nucleotidyltransferase/poly(A) polymerase